MEVSTPQPSGMENMLYICSHYDSTYIVKKHNTIYGEGVKIVKVLKQGKLFSWLKKDSNIISDYVLSELTEELKVELL